MENNDQIEKVTEPKKIEVITGNGNLNISPVSQYIEVEKPKPKDNRKVIIPKVKNKITQTINDKSHKK